MTLILASGSASRRAMLDAAGVTHDAVPAQVDEAAVKQVLISEGAAPAVIALALAKAKALEVSALHPGRFVIGGDSVVHVAGRFFDKPASKADAAAHLHAFSGERMTLVSAAVLARDTLVTDSVAEEAILTVRTLSDAFITDYLDAEWPAIAGCAGCFKMEARGVQLFERVEGDHFTILGMPLPWVLGALRRAGEIAS